MQMADGYSENVTVDEGVVDGIRTQLHFEGQDLIVQKTYDAEPHLRYAEEARIRTAGMGWGEGRVVGHIPPLEYARISQIKDRNDREKAVRLFLQENNKFVMFDRYLK
jgi:hypothetical protein